MNGFSYKTHPRQPIDKIGLSPRNRARDIIRHVAIREYGMAWKEVAEALMVSEKIVLRGLREGEEGLRKQGL